jgi:hypothetical protein
MSIIHRILVATLSAFLFTTVVAAQEKGASSFHVISLDVGKIAWITLTEKLEVVIAFKEPIDDIHSAMWTKARDIDSALTLVDLLQKTRIQSLEVDTKDPLSLRGAQRCKVRCEIVGLRFAPSQ